MSRSKKSPRKAVQVRDLAPKAAPKGGMTPRHTTAIGYDAAGQPLPGATVTAS